MKGSSDKERVQLKVFIKKVSIPLKFPCLLKATLVSDSNSQPGDVHQFKNGQADFNQSIHLITQANYNRTKALFEDRKVLIMFQMILNNGSAFAGEAAFNLAGKECNRNYDNLQFIEKSPQKNSKVSFAFAAEIIPKSTLHSKNNKQINTTAIKSLKEPYNVPSHPQPSKVKMEGAEEGRKMFISARSGSNFQNVEKQYPTKHLAGQANQQQTYHHRMHDESMRNVSAFRSLAKNNDAELTNFKNRLLNNDKNAPEDSLRNIKQFRSLTKIITERPINQQLNEGIENQKPRLQRIKSLQNLQSDQLSARMKQALSTRSGDEDYKLIRITNQQQDEQEQLNRRVKDKLRQSERKAASLEKKLKKYIDDNEKKIYKISLLEDKKLEFEQMLKNKEDRIKMLEKKFKSVVDEQEETTNLLKTQKAQSDQREAMLKQQITKIEEKSRLFDVQREKAVGELNEALNSLETSEKKCQALLKEKDKQLAQQKNKFTKMMEKISNQLTRKEIQITEFKITVEEITNDKKLLNQKIVELETQLQNQKICLQQISEKLKTQQSLSMSYESEIQALKLDEEYKLKLKRNIAEIRQSQTETNQKLMKHEKANQSLRQQLEEAFAKIDKLIKENEVLQQSLTRQKKSMDIIKASDTNKSKQIEILNHLKATQTAKIKQLKEKMQAQRRQYNEMQSENVGRIQILQRQIHMKNEEINELNWQVSKCQDSIAELNIIIKQQSEEMLKLNHETFQKGEQYRQIEEQMLTLSIEYNQMWSKGAEMEKKYDEEAIQLKFASSQIEDLNAKVAQLERQMEEEKRRYREQSNFSKEKYTELEHLAKEGETTIKDQSKVIDQLKANLLLEAQQVQILREKYLKANNELQFANQSSQEIRKQLDSFSTLRRQLRQKDKELQDKEQQIAFNNNEHKRQISEINKQVVQIQNKFDRYRQNTIESLTRFFNELIKQDEENLKNNFTKQQYNKAAQSYEVFSQQQIGNLQLILINNRAKYCQIIRQASEERQQKQRKCQEQISKLKTRSEQTTASHFTEIANMQDRIARLQKQTQQAQQTNRQTVDRLEAELLDKVQQTEQLKYQIIQKDDRYDELQSNTQKLITQLEEIKQEKHYIEAFHIQYKANCSQNNQSHDFRYSEAESGYQLELSKLHRLIDESEEKVRSLSLRLNEKEEQLRKAQLQMNSLSMSAARLQERAKASAQQIKLLQAEIKTKEYQLKQKNQDVISFSKKIEQMDRNLASLTAINIQLKQKLQHSDGLNQITEKFRGQKENLAQDQSKQNQIVNKLKLKIQCQKIQYQRLTKEVKVLSQANISLASELQLKKFLIKQLQSNCQVEDNEKKQLLKEIEQRKMQVRMLNEQLMVQKQRALDLQDGITTVQSERESLSSNLQRCSTIIKRLQKEQLQQIQLKERIDSLEQQNQRLSNEKAEAEKFYERQIIELKSLMREVKKTEVQKSKRQHDLKQKIRSLEKLLQIQQPDLALERINLKQQFEREKRQLTLKLDKLEQENSNLNDEAASMRQQVKKLEATQAQTSGEFIEKLKQKQALISQQKLQIEKWRYKMNELEIDGILFQKQRSNLSLGSKSN